MLFLLASLSTSFALTYALSTSDEDADRRMRRVAWTLGEPSAEVKLAGHGELWPDRFVYDGMTVARCSDDDAGGRAGALRISDVRALFEEQGSLLYEARLAAAEKSASELWRHVPCLAEAVDEAPEQALLASAFYRSALAEYRVVFMNTRASQPAMDAALGRAAEKAQLATRFDAPTSSEVARLIVENEDGRLLIEEATERTAKCNLHLLFGGAVSMVLDNARSAQVSCQRIRGSTSPRCFATGCWRKRSCWRQSPSPARTVWPRSRTPMKRVTRSSTGSRVTRACRRAWSRRRSPAIKPWSCWLPTAACADWMSVIRQGPRGDPKSRSAGSRERCLPH